MCEGGLAYANAKCQKPGENSRNQYSTTHPKEPLEIKTTRISCGRFLCSCDIQYPIIWCLLRTQNGICKTSISKWRSFSLSGNGAIVEHSFVVIYQSAWFIWVVDNQTEIKVCAQHFPSAKVVFSSILSSLFHFSLAAIQEKRQRLHCFRTNKIK